MINLTKKHDDCRLEIRSLAHSRDNKVHREVRDTRQSGHTPDMIMPVENCSKKKEDRILKQQRTSLVSTESEPSSTQVLYDDDGLNQLPLGEYKTIADYTALKAEEPKE